MTEWAQVKGGAPPPQSIERGRWYPIERVEGDWVRVLDPNAASVPLRAHLFRFRDRKPNTITRIQRTGFQAVSHHQPVPEMTFYGVCPEGHRIDSLTCYAHEGNCEECSRTYEVENEEHY